MDLFLGDLYHEILDKPLMDLHGQKEPTFFSMEAIFIPEGLGLANKVMHPQLIDQNALQNTTLYHLPFFPLFFLFSH